MHALLTSITIIVLAIIAVQDFKQRMISWYLLPVLFLLFGREAARSLGIGDAANYFIVNLAFVLFQLFVLTVYFSIKAGRPVNIIDTWLGTGDLLLFVVLCLAFSPLNYFLFYMVSLLLSIAGYLLYRLVRSREEITIPLAGAQSIALIIVLCWQAFSELNLYDDTPALQLIISY